MNNSYDVDGINMFITYGKLDNISVLINLYSECNNNQVKTELKKLLISKKNIIEQALYETSNSDEELNQIDDYLYQTLEIFQIINGC